MATMNVSLPDQMRDWVDAQARSGRYGNASDYIRDLIRHDQEREAKIAHMQMLVDEAVERGPSKLTFAEMRAEAQRRFGPNDL